MIINIVSIVIFWTVQISALLVFFVPFSWGLVALWGASHFVRAIRLQHNVSSLLCASSRVSDDPRGALLLDARRDRRDAEGAAVVGGPPREPPPLKSADREGDPHSPMVSGFYYAHIGWFLNATRATTGSFRADQLRSYGTSPAAPEIVWLQRFFVVPPMALAVIMYLAGGMPWLVWGFCPPTK